MSATRVDSRPTVEDFRALTRFASPIVLIQVGLMFMGVVDTLMVGRVSAEALAAVALGNLYSIGFLIFGLGMLLSLDPVISQALGARDVLAAQRGIQRGLMMALALTVPISFLYLAVEPVLTFVRQPAEVIPIASGYVYRIGVSVFPFLAFVVLRQSLQAHRCTGPIVVTIIAANVINAILNYALIFGRLGFAQMGVLGSAWATVVSRWFMLLLLATLGWTYLGRYLTRPAPRLLSLRPVVRMLAIGMPIGGQIVLEWGAFATIALLMGWLGVVQVAAHQIALNLASLTFMVPVGISSAAAVFVGHAVGRGDMPALRRASAAALIVGCGFMSVTALLFITIPEHFAGLYTDDIDVLRLAALLLPIAGVFQVFDGMQAVGLGILRGMGDTRVPLLASAVGFWCLGIPVSLWLAFRAGLGATGLWWGFVVGLGIVALFLMARIRRHRHRELARLVLD